VDVIVSPKAGVIIVDALSLTFLRSGRDRWNCLDGLGLHLVELAS
jgi:hypothetical protein